MSKVDNPILPILVDNTKVITKEELKQYHLKKGGTLYSVYRIYLKDNITTPFIEYYESYCKSYGIEPPYKILPLNLKTKDWREIVRERITTEAVEAIIDNMCQIALGESKSSISAAQILADWYGIPKESTVKVDASVDACVDANINIKPDLFKLPE